MPVPSGLTTRAWTVPVSIMNTVGNRSLQCGLNFCLMEYLNHLDSAYLSFTIVDYFKKTTRIIFTLVETEFKTRDFGTEARK